MILFQVYRAGPVAVGFLNPPPDRAFVFEPTPLTFVVNDRRTYEVNINGRQYTYNNISTNTVHVLFSKVDQNTKLSGEALGWYTMFGSEHRFVWEAPIRDSLGYSRRKLPVLIILHLSYP